MNKSFSKGIVSNTNTQNSLVNNAFVLTLTSDHGSSGSPVFNTDGKIAGVISGGVGNFTIASTSTSVTKLVKQVFLNSSADSIKAYTPTDKEITAQLFLDQRESLVACYQDECWSGNCFKQQLSLDVQIDKCGKVEKVELEVGSYGANFLNCVGKVISSVRFPIPALCSSVEIKHLLNFYPVTRK